MIEIPRSPRAQLLQTKNDAVMASKWERTSFFGAKQQVRIEVKENGYCAIQLVAQGAFSNILSNLFARDIGVYVKKESLTNQIDLSKLSQGIKKFEQELFNDLIDQTDSMDNVVERMITKVSLLSPGMQKVHKESIPIISTSPGVPNAPKAVDPEEHKFKILLAQLNMAIAVGQRLKAEAQKYGLSDELFNKTLNKAELLKKEADYHHVTNQIPLWTEKTKRVIKEIEADLPDLRITLAAYLAARNKSDN